MAERGKLTIDPNDFAVGVDGIDVVVTVKPLPASTGKVTKQKVARMLHGLVIAGNYVDTPAGQAFIPNPEHLEIVLQVKDIGL
jgi:hypothetical protein